MTGRMAALCCAVVVCCALVACSENGADDTRLTIGTGAWGGNYRVVGQAIARRVNQGELRMLDVSSPGSIANIDALEAGTIGFGLAQADHQYQAVNGLGDWTEAGPQSALRSVLSLYTEAVTVVAGGDSGIHTLADLEGRRVDIGVPGSGTRRNAIEALTAAGLAWQTDLEVRGEDLDDRLTLFMHSELDAFFYTVGHPNRDIKFATYSVRGARFVPLANIDAILAANPYYSRARIRIADYPRADNDADVATVGVRATLVTSAAVTDEAVYTVTQSLLVGLEALVEDAPVLASLSRERAFEGLTAPLHPGALRYYEELGLSIPAALR